MVNLSAAVIGDARTSEFGWTVLRDLADIGDRMAGTAGERRGAERVVEAFNDAGLRNAGLETFDVPGWWRGDAALELAGPVERRHDGSHETIALPGSPADTVSGPIVDVGDGTPAEFETAGSAIDGAIVVASSATPDGHGRWIHRMEKYVAAAERGAAAFVFRNHLEGSLPPTGEVGYHIRPGPIPAVGVSAEVGARLTRLASTTTPPDGDSITATDGDAIATVEVDCRSEPTRSVTAVADVGPATDRAVWLTAHVDAHDISDGANDNAAGCALVAEVGRLLDSVADELDTRVHLAAFGAEEIGLWGAAHAVSTTPHESIDCVINLDGVCSSRTLRLGTNGFDALREPFEAVTERFAAPLSVEETISPHGDQWAFVQEGIPGAMVSTTSDGSGRGWGHTHADTLDKLDPRDLREVATLVAAATYRIARDEFDIEHRSREAIRDAIDDGYERELKTGGRWPYDESA